MRNIIIVFIVCLCASIAWASEQIIPSLKQQCLLTICRNRQKLQQHLSLLPESLRKDLNVEYARHLSVYEESGELTLKKAVKLLPIAEKICPNFLRFAYQQCQSTPHSDWRRVYSPDYTKMAIQTENAVWVIDGEAQKIFPIQNSQCQSRSFIENFCFSADGNSLLLWRRVLDQDDRLTNYIRSLRQIDISNHEEKTVTQFTGNPSSVSRINALHNPTALSWINGSSVNTYDGNCIKEFPLRDKHFDNHILSPNQDYIAFYNDLNIYLCSLHTMTGEKTKREQLKIYPNQILRLWWLPDNIHLLVLVEANLSPWNKSLELYNRLTKKWKTIFVEPISNYVSYSYSLRYGTWLPACSSTLCAQKPISCSHDGRQIVFTTRVRNASFTCIPRFDPTMYRFYSYDLDHGLARIGEKKTTQLSSYDLDGATVICSPNGSCCLAEIKQTSTGNLEKTCGCWKRKKQNLTATSSENH